MDYMTTGQAAEKWGVTLRWVQMYLKDGRIDGAIQFSGVWMIPKDAVKPEDGRRKAQRDIKKLEGADLNGTSKH